MPTDSFQRAQAYDALHKAQSQGYTYARAIVALRFAKQGIIIDKVEKDELPIYFWGMTSGRGIWAILVRKTFVC